MNPDQFHADEVLLVPELVLLESGLAREQAVVVSSGYFTAVGDAGEVIRKHPHLSPVRMDGHLLMPGFVDAHHHLTQTFGKALSFGEPSEIFRRVWIPLEQALDEQGAYLAAKLAALESLRGGFTTVAEAGTRADVDLSAIAAATGEAGLRCVLSKVCVDQGEHAQSSERVLSEAEDHLDRWAEHPLVSPSLAVPITESSTEDTLRAVADLCTQADAVLQMHVNEHLAAVERSLTTVGCRPLEYLDRIGVLGPHLLAAHATLLSPAELRLLGETSTAVSYNPVASAWKGNAVAPAASMADGGVRFGIGTDGTRSDGFRLLDAAESAQRLAFGLASGDSSCGAGWTWLEHATARGADAVGLGATTGTIAVGKHADFLIVDTRVPEMQPLDDPTWQLVRLGNRDQIVAVVTAGRLRLWQGWPPDWDGPALVIQATKAAAEVVARAPIQRVHPTATETQRGGTR